jgi:hypothetical protein
MKLIFSSVTGQPEIIHPERRGRWKHRIDVDNRALPPAISH